MESILFGTVAHRERGGLVEGIHAPDELVRAGGVWIHAAGNVPLNAGHFKLRPVGRRVWLALEEGDATLIAFDWTLALHAGEACFLPAEGNAALAVLTPRARCLWIAFEGDNAPLAARRLGALSPVSTRQIAPLFQRDLARQIAQVVSLHSGSDTASLQLEYLMYGLLAGHLGQPVIMDAPISPEIARVVDALSASRYRDNLSLQEMAAIAGMPLETFRKRFAGEIGLPPSRYALHCKIERAKALLCEPGRTVHQVALEVGIHDPYHFSRQFKNVVGLSPSAFMRLVGRTDSPRE